MSELPDRFDFASAEPEIYASWLAANCFHIEASESDRVGGDSEPYTIVMPPPNVTAILHVGHGLNNTIQDVIVRWARMKGEGALWVPGTDHAGIATQNVVEKMLAAEGKTRNDLGRETFVERTEAFVEETGGVILQQLKAIGASADWSRTAYTLSPELSRAVREAFVRLYERGLIYRGYRVIHWCPRCLTSLSDEEAEFHDEPGTLYHIAYPVDGQPGRSLTIATTRPETMLADVAVAVNPERRSVSRSRWEDGAAADRGRVDPGGGRRLRRSGIRHGRREDHAGARRERLRGGQATLVADADRDRRARRRARGERRRRPRAGVDQRFGSVRGARQDRRAVARVGRAAEDRSAPARRAALLSVRHGGRAATVGSMVREDGAARRAGARRVPRGSDPHSAGALGSGVRELAYGHPRLEHLAPALVGTPHSGVVLRRMRSAAEHHREPRRRHDVPALRVSRAPGRGRARHVVLLVALADLHARLARRDRAGSRRVLPDRHARDRAGDPLLLGRPHGDGGLRVHGPRAVPHRLLARDGARHAAPQDVEVAGQRDRPARRREALWCRRAAVDARRRNGHGRRRDPRPGRHRQVVRDGAQLRHEALEHRPVPARPRGNRAGRAG